VGSEGGGEARGVGTGASTPVDNHCVPRMLGAPSRSKPAAPGRCSGQSASAAMREQEKEKERGQTRAAPLGETLCTPWALSCVGPRNRGGARGRERSGGRSGGQGGGGAGGSTPLSAELRADDSAPASDPPFGAPALRPGGAPRRPQMTETLAGRHRSRNLCHRPAMTGALDGSRQPERASGKTKLRRTRRN